MVSTLTLYSHVVFSRNLWARIGKDCFKQGFSTNRSYVEML